MCERSIYEEQTFSRNRYENMYINITLENTEYEKSTSKILSFVLEGRTIQVLTHIVTERFVYSVLEYIHIL